MKKLESMTLNSNLFKKSVLFVCTHNAVRSQMAEAFLNNIYGDRFAAFSAGSDPTQMDPLVITVMKEVRIDLRDYKSKGLNVFQNYKFDYVVTVCDHARESCPYFPEGHIRLHKSFSDPSTFQGSPEDRLEKYKRVRDEILKWIKKEFN